MDTTTELTPTELTKAEIVNPNFFASKDLFEHAQRVAVMFSKSDMVPKRYMNNIGNCIIALEMANRMGASPLMVMQNLDIILGKPGWSSKFLIATLNQCGKFSPLRYEEDEKDGGRTRAWAIDKLSKEKVYGAWVSMDMAKAELWIDKNGSKWKTMPELMRRYRAASFFVNQFAPEVSMGLRTVEDIHDTEVIDITPKVNKEEERITLMIKDAKTADDLEKLRGHISTDGQVELFADKQQELTKKKK
jgi:hypothetical protein